MERLRHEINRLKGMLSNLGAAVEDQLLKAVESISSKNAATAETVLTDDTKIDVMEVELEEECLKILALHQPVAIDLRVIVAILKINNDLERIGDFAANIAARAKDLADFPPYQFPEMLAEMTQNVRAMLRKTVDALLRMDADLAAEVLRADDRIDQIHRQMYQRTYDEITKDVSSVQLAIELLSVSRYLERIGDLSTNIAEDVIYIVQGRIVRHGIRDVKGSASRGS